MAFDFEALVGHLNIVGGRPLSAQPPGMLVEVAPRRAARGRELDTFFALVTPSGDSTAPPAFYEQMVNLGAERYFNTSGSVTAALRNVFITLNQDLFEHNASGKRRYEASLICAVLRDDELFLARVGAGVALYRHDGQLQAFPTDFSNDEALFGTPMGIHPVPDIKMSRQSVAQGSRLILSDERLADMDMAKITAALGKDDITSVLDSLKALNSTQLALLLAEYVPSEAPSPVPVKDAHTTARTAKTETSEQPVVVSAAAPVSPKSAAPVENKRRSGLFQRGAGQAALGAAGAMERANHLLGRMLPEPSEGQRPWLKTSTATAIAILIPIAIVVLVVFMGLGGTGQSEFELCVEEADKTAQVARGIVSSDVNGTKAAWNAVLAVVSRCSVIREGDPTLAELTREGQAVIDALLQVDRRTTTPLASFTNAVLTQILLQGLDLYVLDSQNELVYRVTLGSDGRSVVTNSTQTVASMRLGAVVGEYRVDELVDVAWLEATAQVMALDRAGLLVKCSPRFLQSCEAELLLAPERWISPVSITIWQERLYVLDPGANQIWKYDSTGGSYRSTPTEYFAGVGRPDIRNAVDFGIDDDGSVYILTADGQITKWVSGEQTPFAYASFPEGQALTSATALFLDNNPILQALYIIDRPTRTVYETSLAGTFNFSYRAFNENDFASLANAVADANQQVVYAVSGNSVFVFDKRTVP